MTNKQIHPLLNRIINNGGILSMHRDKFEAEKRAAFAAGVEAAAKVAETGVDLPHPTMPTHTLRGWDKSAHIAAAIRAIGRETKDQ